MAVFSPLSSRRSARRHTVRSQQLIVFRVRNEGFALPIWAVQKVIPMGKTYGAATGRGVTLTLYQDQELIVIDAELRIFRDAPNVSASSSALTESTTLPTSDSQTQRYLLIVQSSQVKQVGLPIEEPPSLLRVPESAFSPLTKDYLAEGNIRCVSALIKLNEDESPLFLLNPDQLVQSQQALPGT